MVWVYHGKSAGEKDIGEAIREIEGGSDRSAAIVAAAFLEDTLQTALELHLCDNPKVATRMFAYPGPLSTFAAKIDLSCLIGLIGEESRRELHVIREVRNEFAHRLGKRTFEYQRVRDLVENLKIIESSLLTIKGPKGNSIPLFSVDSKIKSGEKMAPRDRFTDSCKWYIAVLATFSAQGPNRPPEPDRL